MNIPEKTIFTDNRALLVGYSKDPSSFSRIVYHGLEEAGIKVYPYNPKEGEYDVKVYNNYTDIENLPETGVVLLGKKSLAAAMEEILQSGLKKVIVNTKAAVTQDIRDKFSEAGIEVHTLCPLMITGGGIHGLHRFFARLFS